MERIKNIFKTTEQFLRPGLFVFSILLFFLIFIALYDVLNLPSDEQVVRWIENLFLDYGIVIVLVGAFVESLFMLSMYFPGSTVLVLSVFVLGSSWVNLVLIVLLVVIGYSLANSINYWLGKYGYYKLLLKLGGSNYVSQTQEKFRRNSKHTLFWSGFHPNFLSITTVVAGIAHHGFTKTLLQTTSINTVWTIFWVAVFAFAASRISYDDIGGTPTWIFFAVIFVWGLGQCVYTYIKESYNHAS